MYILKYHKWKTIFSIILSLLPVILYIVYIYKFGVNVPFSDDWYIVRFYNDLYTHTLTIKTLWFLHNGHRLLFPNILFIIVAYFTKINVKILMYISCLFLIGSYYLIVLFYKRLKYNLWFFIPVSWVLFSPVQWEDSIWGFQLAWYMILFFALLSFYLLMNAKVHKSFVPLSVLSGIVASYSSLQGLIVWPVGLLFIVIMIYEDIENKSFWRKLSFFWILIGTVCIIIYSYGFNFNKDGGSSALYFLYHPENSLRYFLSTTGEVVVRNPAKLSAYISQVIGSTGLRYQHIIDFGIYWVTNIIILWYFLYIVLIFLFFFSTKDKKQVIPYVMFMLYGLLFNFLTLVGRSYFGISEAFSSRYSIYNLLLFIGVYLSLLTIYKELKEQYHYDRLFKFVLSGFFILIVVQVFMAYPYGIYQGKLRKSDSERNANLILFYSKLKDPSFTKTMDQPTFDNLSFVPFLESHKLSVFAHPYSYNLYENYERAIHQYPQYKQALLVLFKIYLMTPPLQKTIQMTDKSIVKKLITWAVNTGIKIDTFKEQLSPFMKQYKQLMALSTL